MLLHLEVLLASPIRVQLVAPDKSNPGKPTGIDSAVEGTAGLCEPLGRLEPAVDLGVHGSRQGRQGHPHPPGGHHVCRRCLPIQIAAGKVIMEVLWRRSPFFIP